MDIFMNNYIFIKCGVFVDDNREDIGENIKYIS